MDKPRRVQLSRKKGWKMPENTVSAARPGKWGNPFVVGDTPWGREPFTPETAVQAFREWVEPYAVRAELRGKNLACWCALNAPCHADVLLEIANAPLQALADGGRE
jgi:hypothetical protein